MQPRRPLHIEPRARGTAYIDFGDAQTADHVAEQLDQAHLPNGTGKITAKREKLSLGVTRRLPPAYAQYA